MIHRPRPPHGPRAAALLCLAALALPAPATALPPVRSYETCIDRVTNDAEAGREAALEWRRFGHGGAQARICEANALSALGAHGSAGQALDLAAREAPAARRPGIFALAAELWLAAGRPAEALASAEAALKSAPEGAAARRDALAVRARVRLAEAAWTAAAIDLSGALSLPGDDRRAELLALRAEARVGMGDAPGALEDAAAAAVAAPGLAHAWLQKGLAETALGRAEAARESLLRAIREDGPAPGGAAAAAARAAIQAAAYGG
ncbi:hypothetical protein ACQ5SO_08015 [Rhodovulum sp. DZ06]|uniref:hypothetical protein n=1 Tax=Rhodovulum sp. DZ06 TaxID=3425126 RepID=UPI003D353E5C